MLQIIATSILKKSLGKKETRIFYIDNIIKFNIFLELLWKFTLLILYRVNRFRPQRIEPVGYMCIFIWKLLQVHTVK